LPLVLVKSASSQKALQDLHVRPRTASAGAYHHPGVSNLGLWSGYHACETSRISLHEALSSAFRRLRSVLTSRLWHRRSLKLASQPLMWALNLRCLPSRYSCVFARTMSTSVTSSIHCSPRAWRLRHRASSDLLCSDCWCPFGVCGCRSVVTMVKIPVTMWMRPRTPSPLWLQLYQKITIKDEKNEFDDREFKDEYEKIHRDIEEFTDPIIKALSGLPVYYRFISKKG